MADEVKSTTIIARGTSAFRTKKKLMGDSLRKKDKPVDTGKLKTCTTAAKNRQDSPLLRLPAEIRNRVYTMALQAECVLVRSRYLTAFDMTVELRSCCSNIPPTNSQTWSDCNSIALLPIMCRQMYEETHGLLYALNTFAFTDEQSMRIWVSCRAQCQRKLICSPKLPNTVTGYYGSSYGINFAAVCPQLRTICIDVWGIVTRENELEGVSQEELLQLLAAEKARACQKEGGSVKIVATECVYRSTIFGAFLDPA
ncbi:hypothetical protein E8E12_005267 [Didymella heteroderae]|uniref:DUF7730 domain-containing protein n=1 Tax=Didymella heteroderae TaxID=1769908 RepID=A0A9P4WRT3_9PLEO|nr:hypothetical protein E8E12_005267 [Didymella heteroderae]